MENSVHKCQISVGKKSLDFENTVQRSLNTTIVYISFVSIVLYSLLYFIGGEKLPVSDGLGWDGVTYAAYATNFLHEITSTSDCYHVTRMFPSLVIYIVAKVLGFKLSTPHDVFTAFYILNTVMFLGVAYLWYKICQFKSFNIYIYLMGFISFFINYACLKLSPYAPVFVDPTVLFFATAILFLFLRKQYIAICAVSLPVFFTWPIALILTAPLLIYTFTDKNILSSMSQKSDAAIVVGLFTVCMSTLLYLVIKHGNLLPSSVSDSWNIVWWPQRHASIWLYLVLLPVSVLITSIYIYFLAIYGANLNLLKNAYKVSIPNVFLFILLAVVCTGLSFWLTHLSSNYTGKTLFSGSEFIALTLLGSVAKPAFNLIMNATYLGPCTILWLIYMRPIMVAANEESFGLLLLVLLTFFMALNSHSRQLTFNMPFMIYLLCKVFNNFNAIKNKSRFLILYTLAALLGSKIYYLINVAPMEGSIFSYPFQRFFMHLGLWTMWPGYFFNLGLTIAMCLLLIYSFRHYRYR